MSMKAVRFHGAKDVRLDTLPIPSTKPGWVRVKPAYTGICGSDLHEYEDGPHIIPAKGSPHGLTGEELPVTLGHEFSAVVNEVGEGVTHVKPGDGVCIQPTIYDGDCRSCKRGLTNCCDGFGFIGLSGWGGGMSEYTVAPANYVKPLPKGFPLDIGALVEPLAVGWHAVANSPYKDGDDVLVLGGGPIGLAVVLALLGKGCKNIMVAEVSRRRREFALQFGAHRVIDPSSQDVVEEVKKITAGEGADVAFDAAGVQAAVYSAIKAIKGRGTLVNIALWGSKEVSLNMTDMLFGERKYQAVVTYTEGDFESVIDAIHTGKIKPGGMITEVLSMNEVDKGFKLLTEDKDNQVKILIQIGDFLAIVRRSAVCQMKLSSPPETIFFVVNERPARTQVTLHVHARLRFCDPKCPSLSDVESDPRMINCGGPRLELLE